MIKLTTKELLTKFIARYSELISTKEVSDYQSTYNDGVYFYIEAFIKRHPNLFKEFNVSTDRNNQNVIEARNARISEFTPSLRIEDDSYNDIESIIKMAPTINTGDNFRANTPAFSLMIDYYNEKQFNIMVNHAIENAILHSADTERTPHDILELFQEVMNRVEAHD